ncbi:MAG TPA: hypothetical protein VJ438_02310 [Candidatus Nanoarchaeia archaeon]|nr:hypothetical protein [Candidatus Nanoarchaeia archaeon]
MGLIRGGLFTLVCVLLFVSLFAMSTLLTISMSLSHDNVQEELVSIVGNQIRNQTSVASDINTDLRDMQIYCADNIQFVKEYNNFVYTFPCEVVFEGSESVVTFAINQFVDDVYYKEYDCNFWDCDFTPPYHLISAKAQSYWTGWFYWSLFISLVLVGLTFVLIEDRKNLPFVIGGLLMISALPFIRVSWLLSLLGYWEFLQFFALFFSKSYSVFLISFVIGILLIGIGLVLKFLGIGKFIGELVGSNKSGKTSIDKEQLKEEIKEEINIENKKKSSK